MLACRAPSLSCPGWFQHCATSSPWCYWLVVQPGELVLECQTFPPLLDPRYAVPQTADRNVDLLSQETPVSSYMHGFGQ